MATEVESPRSPRGACALDSDERRVDARRVKKRDSAIQSRFRELLRARDRLAEKTTRTAQDVVPTKRRHCFTIAIELDYLLLHLFDL